MEYISIKNGLKKLSEIKDEKISTQNVINKLGQNAAQIIIIIFCSPTALPTPALPILTQILSAIVILTLAQLIIRKKQIWLPEKLREKELSNDLVTNSANKLLQYHKKIEKFIKPRIRFLSIAPFNLTIYLLCGFFSIVVALPIPFSNTVPSIAIIIIMLGMIERDGIIIITGITIGIIGVVSLFLFYFYGISFISS